MGNSSDCHLESTGRSWQAADQGLEEIAWPLNQLFAADRSLFTVPAESNPAKKRDWWTRRVPDDCVDFIYHQSVPDRWLLFNYIIPA